MYNSTHESIHKIKMINTYAINSIMNNNNNGINNIRIQRTLKYLLNLRNKSETAYINIVHFLQILHLKSSNEKGADIVPKISFLFYTIKTYQENCFTNLYTKEKKNIIHERAEYI